MKRILPLVIALMMVLSLAACTVHDPANTPDTGADDVREDVTAAPDDAGESEDPGTARTEEPTEAPEGCFEGLYDYCEQLGDEPLVCDLDFDGADDTVTLVRVSGDMYEGDYTVGLNLGCGKGFTIDLRMAYDVRAWVCELDPLDSRLDVLITYMRDSEDSVSEAFKLSGDGSELVSCSSDCEVIINEEHPFTTENGFFASIEVDLLGTYDIDGQMTVDAHGFDLLDDAFTCRFGDRPAAVLKREMKAYLLEKDGDDAKITIPVGGTIRPVYTDNAAFIVVELADERLALIEFERGDDWGIYIDGVRQEEYADFLFED